MSEAKPKGELLFARQLDKATKDLLLELIDRGNNPELTLEARAKAMLAAGQILYGPVDEEGH
jgi:hypothetical protein